MKSNAVVTRNVGNHHITIIGDPRPYQPLKPTQVPDGGSGWAFVLAAAMTIGLATAYRYFQGRDAGKVVAASN